MLIGIQSIKKVRLAKYLLNFGKIDKMSQKYRVSQGTGPGAELKGGPKKKNLTKNFLLPKMIMIWPVRFFLLHID